MHKRRTVHLTGKYMICLLLAMMVLVGTALREANAEIVTPTNIDNGFEWITHVSLGDMVDNSVWAGWPGYSHSGRTASVKIGETYTLAVEIDPHPWGNEYVYVWINWNGDLEWGNDGGPIVLAIGTSQPGPHTQSITVPAGAATDSTLQMRVSLKYGSPPAPNEDGFEGEVKDYDVYIDTIAPSAITDLATAAVTASSITLNWTAPGDDGNSGTAASYDVRYATVPINSSNWASATAAVGEPAPQSAGSLQSFMVTGLNPATTYYFAIKTTDDADNESGRSNIANATTNSPSPQYSISGRVFEDTTYGGGNGRSYAAASGTARSGARVELYDGSSGYITFDDTDASGSYTFSGLSAGTYGVRVVNSTVTSSRTGANGSEVAVQTFRIDGDGEPVGTGSSKVGGEQPQSVDASANNGSQTLADLQLPAGQHTQSLVMVDASSGNVSDVDFGFSFDVIVNTNNSGQGALRQFILNANLLGGIQTSQFMVPASDTRYNGSGNGEYSISPSTTLPTITDTIVLDGSTQTSNMGDTNANGPEIEISGNLLPAVSGLVITSSANGCTIRGLTINQFIEDGIDIHSNSNTVQGNYIGTDVTGNLSRGNGDDGINIEGGDSNKIGGTNPGEGNLVAGNLDDGVNLRVGANDNTVQGNYVGTNAAGSNTISNGDTGILIWNGSNNNLIGGTSASAANTIAFNDSSGILISDSTGCSVVGNAIHSNGGLGIDLSATNVPDGVAVNDPNDFDSGANDLLNYPVITAANASGGSVTVDFNLDVPAGTYRIDFFYNPSGADPTGHGEGQNPADALSIVHSGGTQSFSHTFAGGGGIISATATADVAGDLGSTSEFSEVFTAIELATDIRLSKSVVLDSDPFNNTTNPKAIPGALLVYTVTVSNQGPGTTDADTVIITNPIGSDAALFVGDLSGTGSAVIFQNGSPTSGLSLNDRDITYSNNNGSTFDYTPPGGTDYDPAITHLRINPSGIFSASDGTNHPNFSLQFRVRVR